MSGKASDYRSGFLYRDLSDSRIRQRAQKACFRKRAHAPVATTGFKPVDHFLMMHMFFFGERHENIHVEKKAGHAQSPSSRAALTISDVIFLPRDATTRRPFGNLLRRGDGESTGGAPWPLRTSSLRAVPSVTPLPLA